MTKRLDEATKKRLRAGRMLLSGKRPAEVAEKVGVARQTVYIYGKACWMKAVLMHNAEFLSVADQPRWAHRSKFLPGESGRVAHERTQQAQECAKTPFDHRCLLGAGYALVMS